jgi:hypothetical protein
VPDYSIPPPTIEKSEGLIMSQPQKEEITVSAFLQRVEEARKKNQEPPICYEHLKIVNDKDPGSEQQLLDLRGLHLRCVDFRDLDASGALCTAAVAYRCNFQESNWSNAQGSFQIRASNVSCANFTDTQFIFFDSYRAKSVPAQGLNAEQTQSIIPVSPETIILLGRCDNELFAHTIEQENRILGLEEKLAALAAQVDRLREQR